MKQRRARTRIRIDGPSLVLGQSLGRGPPGGRGFRLLWILRSVALVLVASLVLAIGLQPSIQWLENRGLRRGWALAAILLAGLILLGGLGVVLVPFLVEQISTLIEEFPAFVEQLQQTPGIVGSIAQSIDVGSLAGGSEGPSGGGDLSPLGVITAILIGGSAAGLFGALLALPIAAMIKIIVFELLVPERIGRVGDKPNPGRPFAPSERPAGVRVCDLH